MRGKAHSLTLVGIAYIAAVAVGMLGMFLGGSTPMRRRAAWSDGPNTRM